MLPLGQIQIGRQGLTDNLLATLKTHFNKFKNMKVKVLKSGGHDKKQVKEYSEKILKYLGVYYTARVIGFTIFVKKWRKVKR